MAKRKGRDTRSKSRVSRAPMAPTTGYLTDICVVLEPMDSSATGLCPWCAGTVVQLEPSGHAGTTERASVETVQAATG